jgi:hypothetical protein
MFIQYGTGFVAGTYNYDNVQIGGTEVTKYGFGSATMMAEFFEETPIAGILGLAFQNLSAGGMPPVFDVMLKEGIISEPVFSVYLDHENTEDSFVLFGGNAIDYYTGNLSYVDIQQWEKKWPYNFWLIDFEKISIGSTAVRECGGIHGSCRAIVDTGTTVIAGPDWQVKDLIKKIGTVAPDCSNIDTLPIITWTINGVNFPLSPKVYVIKEEMDDGSFACELGIESMQTTPFDGTPWILGDPFLRQYFSLWDKSTTPPRIGFAPSVGAPKI